jgi:hypothetical protein
MNARGDNPLGVLRGDVTPPAIWFARDIALSDAYTGFSERCT